MAIARGELQSLSFKKESTFKTRAAGNFTPFWHNTESIVPTRGSFESGRALGDRQIGDMRLGRKSVSGDVVSELVYTNHDDLFEGLLCGTINASPFAAITADTISVTGTTNTIADSGSGFGSISVGDYIYTSLFTNEANNGLFKVKTAAAGSITIEGPANTLADESAGTNRTIREVDLVNGIDEVWYTIHKDYTDISVDEDYLGCMIASGALAVPANGIATMTWSFLGAQFDDAAGAVTLDALSQYSPFDGLSGTYAIAGLSTTAVMTAFNLTIDNGPTHTEPLGSDEASDVIPRKFRVTGSFNVYHEGNTEIARHYDETETSLIITLADPDGNQMVFLLPRVKYTAAGTTKTDDGPAMTAINFTALKDVAKSDKTCGIVKIAAP